MSLHKNTIYETVIQCHYDKEFLNHITSNINYVNEKKYNNFRIQILNVQGQYLIGIFLDIQTLFENSKKFFVPIQLFIPKNFPYTPPIAKVCLPNTNTIVNSQNYDIDPKTCIIMTNLLRKWDLSTNLNTIIDEISQSFNKNFPILQVQPGYNPNVDIIQQTDFNKQSPPINPSYNPNFNTNQYANYNTNINPYFNPNINPNPNQNQGIKIDIKDNYIDEKLFESDRNSLNSLPDKNVNANWDKFSNSSESTSYTKNTSLSDNQNKTSNMAVTSNIIINHIKNIFLKFSVFN